MPAKPDEFLGYIASSNPGKITEYSRLLGRALEGRKLPVPEIQPSSDDIQLMRRPDGYVTVAEGIARQKAKAAYTLNEQQPILVEDTSLFIDCMEGMPGPLILFFSSPICLRYLCQNVNNPVEGAPKTRRAVAVVVLAAWNGNENEPVQSWRGSVEGTISTEPRGSNGFGWDSIFVPAGSDKTFAEMSAVEKDLFSMRRLAVEELMRRPFVP